ncbi:hypothetical protein COV19_06200 [Candidatus Woesearchaeota archaeon CG10_big_fil_rev_8_21_14_0_10_44_13]|nr:MAG: hypothetical protein COV19_06200 [Candidatus Woesearchaeota archaeon CG10_big_fil_rev_8_21_14_0_10_44_13]
MKEINGNITFGEYNYSFRVPEKYIGGTVGQFLKNLADNGPDDENGPAIIKKTLKRCMESTNAAADKTFVALSRKGSKAAEKVSLKDPIVLYVSSSNGSCHIDGSLVIMEDWKEADSIYDSLEVCKDKLIPYVDKMKQNVESLMTAYNDQNSPIKECSDYVTEAFKITKEERGRKDNVQAYNKEKVQKVLEKNSHIEEANREARQYNEQIKDDNERIMRYNKRVDQEISFRNHHPVLAFLKEILSNVSYEHEELHPEKAEARCEKLELLLYSPKYSVNDWKKCEPGFSVDDGSFDTEGMPRARGPAITEMTPGLEEKIKEIYEKNEKRFEGFETAVNKSILYMSGKTFNLVLNDKGVDIDIVRHPVVSAEIFSRVLAGNIEYQKQRIKALKEEKTKNVQRSKDLADEISSMKNLDDGYYQKKSELTQIELAVRANERELNDTIKNTIDLHDTFERSDMYWRAISQMTQNFTEWVNDTRRLAYTASMNLVFTQGAKDINNLTELVESTGETLSEIGGSYEAMLGKEIGIGCFEKPLSLLNKVMEQWGIKNMPLPDGKSVNQQKKEIVDRRWKELFGEEDEGYESAQP